MNLSHASCSIPSILSVYGYASIEGTDGNKNPVYIREVISMLATKARVEAVSPITRILLKESLERKLNIAKMAGRAKTEPIIG
jgi:hypothetical protein